jgi:hypothetical protein
LGVAASLCICFKDSRILLQLHVPRILIKVFLPIGLENACGPKIEHCRSWPESAEVGEGQVYVVDTSKEKERRGLCVGITGKIDIA